MAPFHPFVLQHGVGVFLVLVGEFGVLEGEVGDAAVVGFRV